MSLQARLEALAAAIGKDMKIGGDPFLKPIMVDGALRQNIDVRAISSGNITTSSGRGVGARVYYKAGDVITTINFVQGATASSSLTRTGGYVTNNALNIVAVCPEDTTTTANAVNTLISRPLTAPYVIPSDGWYWHFITRSGTVGTLVGATAAAVGALNLLGSGALSSGITGSNAPNPLVIGTNLPVSATAGHILTWST